MLKQSLKAASSKSTNQSEFNTHLAKWFMESDIPFNKLSMKSTKFFLQKFTEFECPDESTLRKNYVKPIYTETIQKINSLIDDNRIYLIIDESTDSRQRFVLNIMVGILNGKQHKSMLISSVCLESTNNTTVSQAVLNACHKIWPNGIEYEKLLLIVSDAARYMVKAVNNLKSFFPNLKHVTCVVHTLHLVAENIRQRYPAVNDFISNFKKILTKSSKRVLSYKTITSLPLPPKPVVTRWGTWINTAIFHCQNYDKIELFVNSLKEKDNIALDGLRKAYNNMNLKKEFLELAEYTYLVDSMKKLEKEMMETKDVFEILDLVKSKLDNISLEKFNKCMDKNPDINYFRSFEWGMDILIAIKYAPLVSVDVERSFSRHKSILRDNRNRFTNEQLEMFNIVNFNSFLK